MTSQRPTFVIAVTIYSIIGVLVAATYAPQQVVIWPPQAVRDAVIAVLPEGWSFFTKDPTGPIALPVRRGKAAPQAIDSIDEVVELPSPALARDRRNAMMQVEMVDRAIEARKDAMRSCVRGEPCRTSAEHERVSIVNPLRRPTICGDYDVHVYRPTPWFWRDLVEGAFQREGVARIRVDCRGAS